MTGGKRTAALLAALVLLIIAGAVASLIGQAPPRPLAGPLAGLPERMGEWSMAAADKSLDQRTLDVLRPSDYLMRTYVQKDGFPCSVFIAFFDYQREGRMIHSPLQCLPGGGWTISKKETTFIDGPFGRQTVNHLTLVHQLNKMSVLYWYQGRGRLQHDEYLDRILLAWDSLSKGRNDGALVRLMAPAGPKALEMQTDLAAHISKALQGLMDQSGIGRKGR